MPKRNLLRTINNKNNNKIKTNEKKKLRSEIKLKWDDENVHSSDDDSENSENEKQYKEKKNEKEEEEEEENISAEQKRKKLAKDYLASMQVNESDSESSDEENEDNRYQNLSERLQRDRLEKQGKYVRELSSSFEVLQFENLQRTSYSGHELPVTCVALTSDDTTVYSGSKDNSLMRIDVESGSKVFLRQKWRRSTHGDHQASGGEILSVAVSTDGKYVASGGRDSYVRIYDSRTNSEIKAFSGHRDAVTCLTFRRDSPSLFSGSLDRCIKHWDMNEMGYLETLFGHQDSINSIDCWIKERPLTSGSDRTVRLWNVHDESHLVFRGQKSIIDCCQYVTLDSYLSADENGAICLWKETQKKPISIINHAHGMNGSIPNWITSMATLKISDLAATGSSDGFLRFWSVHPDDKNGLNEINQWNIGPGFINGIALSSRLVVLGLGTEHRLGRWMKVKGAKNRVEIIKLPEEIYQSEGRLHSSRNGNNYKSENSDSNSNSDNSEDESNENEESEDNNSSEDGSSEDDDN